MELSIVIPMHNEAKNAPVLMERIQKTLSSNRIDAEVIAVNDVSTDDTGDVLRKLAKKYSNVHVVTRKDKKGVAKAILAGIQKSKGDVIITMDGDLSHNPRYIPLLLKELYGKNLDIVIGSRYMPEGGMQSNLTRIFISRIFNLFARLTTKIKIKDFTSGYKVYRRKVFENISLKSKGFEIHAEIPVRAVRKGFRIGEIPMVYERRREGSSKLKYLRECFSYLRVLLP